MELTELYDFSSNTGLTTPKTANVRANIASLISSSDSGGSSSADTSILGPNCDTSEATRLGRFISLLADVTNQTTALNAAVANDFNLNEAAGVALDHLGAVFGLERRPATHTFVSWVDITCSAPNVTVPKGTVLSTDDGYDFTLDQDVTTGSVNNVTGWVSSGDMTEDESERTQNGTTVYTAIGTAHAVQTGRVYCPQYKLKTVKTAVVGLLGVSNTVAGVTGRPEETDEQFRKRIRKARDTGASTVGSILNALFSASDSVENHGDVADAVVLENGHAYPVVKDGIVVKPHSIYSCLDDTSDVGYEAMSVAEAYETKKTAGADWTDKTDVFSDLVSIGHGMSVSPTTYYSPFEAISRDLTVTITAKFGTSMYEAGNPAMAVQEAIQDYLAEDGIGKSITKYGIAQMLETLFGDEITLTDIEMNYYGESVDSIELSAGEMFETNCDTTADPRLEVVVSD